MKWVTRDRLHMDRVASPWLVRRHIDAAAEFSFVPFEQADPTIPEGAIAFAIKGAAIGPHDEDGSTFRKLMRAYGLVDRALDRMADIIESGIHHVFHHDDEGYSVEDLACPEGIGLDAIAHGMMYIAQGDNDNIERSMTLYDALYAYCQFRVLVDDCPDIASLPVPALWDRIRDELAKADKCARSPADARSPHGAFPG